MVVQQRAKQVTVIARGVRTDTLLESPIRFRMGSKAIRTTRMKMIMENNTISTATSTAISMLRSMQRVIARPTHLQRGLKRATTATITMRMMSVTTTRRPNMLTKKYTPVHPRATWWTISTQVRRTKARTSIASSSTIRAAITPSRAIGESRSSTRRTWTHGISMNTCKTMNTITGSTSILIHHRRLVASRQEVLPPPTKTAAITNRNNTTPRRAIHNIPLTPTTRRILSHSKSSPHSAVATRQQTSSRRPIPIMVGSTVAPTSTTKTTSTIKSREAKDQPNS